MGLTIQVTQQHIATARNLVKQPGTRRSMCCPVALALREHFPAASCCASSWSPTDDEADEGYPTPHEAADFIRAFDGKCDVEPISFEVEI